MHPELVFDCPYPKYIIEMEDLSRQAFFNLIVGDRFIAMANHFFGYHMPENDHTRYLHLCNRFSRSWISIPFPTIHRTIVGDLDCRCQFKLLGFFRSTVILVLIVNPYVQQGCFSLEYWQLSDDLESVRIVHTASITRNLLPALDVSCFPDEHKMRVFFTGVMRDAAYNEYDPTVQHCIALECTTSASEAVETFAVEVEFDCLVTVLNDKVYLASHTTPYTDTPTHTRIYEYKHGTLVYITTVPQAEPFMISGYGNNFYALTEIEDSGGLLCATEYDLTIGLWSSSIPSDLTCSGYMYTAPSGEMLILMIDSRDEYAGDTFEMEVRVISLIPPKLSTLALRCLQKTMPEETAEKMATSKRICDPISFVQFLFKQPTNSY